MNTHTVHTGDSLEVLKTLPAGSVEAVVTDPPYGLGDMSPAKVAECLQAWASGDTWTPTGKGFMGKQWDAWVPPPELWREVLRVLKPGGHAIVFAGSRTQDIMSVSLRLAGFEVRDTLQWLYGSGFPKSLDVSKAVDKRGGAVASFAQFRDAMRAAMVRTGVTRSVLQAALGNHMLSHYLTQGAQPATPTLQDYLVIRHTLQMGDTWDHLFLPPAQREVIGQYAGDMGGLGGARLGQAHGDITAPATEPAQQWQGWGTALKPAYEPAILARKPLDGTVAQNTLAHGCGALNIDACRVGEEVVTTHGKGTMGGATPIVPLRPDFQGASHVGRWPANVILDEDAAELLDAQTGEPTSRFFYTAKAPRAEREAGLGARARRSWAEGAAALTDGPYNSGTTERANHHPTVKPIALMRYLVKLVTPPHGTVLDPFTGSGSTGCAAALERVNFVGIELDPEYAEIARTRIKHWAQQGEQGEQEPVPPAPEPPAPEPPAPEPQEDKERGGKGSPQLSPQLSLF